MLLKAVRSRKESMAGREEALCSAAAPPGYARKHPLQPKSIKLPVNLQDLHKPCKFWIHMKEEVQKGLLMSPALARK